MNIILCVVIIDDESLAWSTTFLSDEKYKEGMFANMKKMTELILPIVKQGQQSGAIRNQSPAKLLSNTVGLTMMGVIYRWCVMAGKNDLLGSMKTELCNLYDLREELRE